MAADKSLGRSPHPSQIDITFELPGSPALKRGANRVTEQRIAIMLASGRKAGMKRFIDFTGTAHGNGRRKKRIHPLSPGRHRQVSWRRKMADHTQSMDPGIGPAGGIDRTILPGQLLQGLFNTLLDRQTVGLILPAYIVGSFISNNQADFSHVTIARREQRRAPRHRVLPKPTVPGVAIPWCLQVPVQPGRLRYPGPAHQPDQTISAAAAPTVRPSI